MAVYKCKMCGGTLEINNNETVATCEYCGTQQTLPKTTDDVISNLFNRANNLRLKCEFDKAAQIYEKIVQQDDSEAEAHWGLVLCKYGIEYVEDPKTFTRIPTCHRTLFEAVTADADYQAAIDYSDSMQQQIYEKEARAIDRIQKDILAIVKNEKPFDVFICYKETDENGKRTIDSTIANDIYYQLTQEGFKVFYAAITLEDKLGQEYEPYIFAALNSAKVMLALGTKPEYYSAVWVKNEWSRFLQLMKSNRDKLLIPCYRDMDAYDLPEEFAHLQSQDMSKIGFINDIVRGIKKVAGGDIAASPSGTEESSTNISAGETFIKRAMFALEDKEWEEADKFCEKALNINPEDPIAYTIKFLAGVKINNVEKLAYCSDPLGEQHNYNTFKKIRRFVTDAPEYELANKVIEAVDNAAFRTKLDSTYKRAVDIMNNAKSQSDLTEAIEIFDEIKDYADSAECIEKCREYMEYFKYDSPYSVAKKKIDVAEFYDTSGKISTYLDAIAILSPIKGYKDSAELLIKYEKALRDLGYKGEL